MKFSTRHQIECKAFITRKIHPFFKSRKEYITNQNSTLPHSMKTDFKSLKYILIYFTPRDRVIGHKNQGLVSEFQYVEIMIKQCSIFFTMWTSRLCCYHNTMSCQIFYYFLSINFIETGIIYGPYIKLSFQPR